MAIAQPDFTIGIEEEYLLVDRDSLALSPAPTELMERCGAALEGQFSPEFLDCQVEIGTRVCADVAEARDDLRHLRSTVARIAADYNLAPIAASCHPFADWRQQHHTDRDRYNSLRQDLAGVVRRMLICGMHVHVGIDAPDQRIDLMNQLAYFLPHLLALSCSSPYWQGEDTGLSSYRLTVFDNLPRTGLPPRLESWGSFERSVAALTELGVIEDASKIWWDLRPSSRFPTIEARICDGSPRVETTLTLAALVQSLTRMLWRLSLKNQRWRIYDTFLVDENRWRAQRYGLSQGLINFGAHEIVPPDMLADELVALVAEDAAALDALAEVENTRAIVATGNSASLQRGVYARARELGRDHDAAMRAVVAHLIDEFHADL
ncbi:carboxylate-amine ligase [Lutimaribacter sp. EGI FJ00015]|uniref:Carboxylate-amine ligase n=1 Tax=Lutimaribacter degradans TaxID=2945989 RepID=A0ACC5ZVG5_9RHOB|nr:carboxylate-amine ligase [Lutimaribacter sp. EGI FJ00013]MCM2562168.1 carboxylate-amine ligase [Lutimaribacter sp. EGI FJ00013]MCO0613322.1 carboxylate-amine ligase [Lutimaribacter sp. EGI FJ00015]MCO0636297.1 carboxylate-amine ligase [Lutimaribacter sp. EGI FJ00014]